jgi:hypothetical protein
MSWEREKLAKIIISMLMCGKGGKGGKQKWS